MPNILKVARKWDLFRRWNRDFGPQQRQIFLNRREVFFVGIFWFMRSILHVFRIPLWGSFFPRPVARERERDRHRERETERERKRSQEKSYVDIYICMFVYSGFVWRAYVCVVKAISYTYAHFWISIYTCIYMCWLDYTRVWFCIWKCTTGVCMYGGGGHILHTCAYLN